jgi:hypothetical protein
MESCQSSVAWRGGRPQRGRSARGLSALKRRKTSRAPMLMVKAWVRAPSIRRSEPPGDVCLAARSAAACAPCLGSGSASKSLAHACIGRPLELAGTGCPRWLWWLAGSCCAEMLPITAAEAGKALGPMLPASAWEHWPSCVLRAMVSPVHDCVATKMGNELFLLQAIGQEDEGGEMKVVSPPVHRGRPPPADRVAIRLDAQLVASIASCLSLCSHCRVLTVCSGVWCGRCGGSGRA